MASPFGFMTVVLRGAVALWRGERLNNHSARREPDSSRGRPLRWLTALVLGGTKAGSALITPDLIRATTADKRLSALKSFGSVHAGDGLKPSKFGKRIHFSGAKRSVTDGPFAETKELVAGYWVWQVRSMEEAVEWAKRCPNPMPGPSDLEIRPFWESEDFEPRDRGTGERPP